ncbi:YlmC/YmxH family sporulation protein [Thermoflavimicrobium daqui]|jgi:YlmC/YmxH family sporulation protein|uniref:YlmC/YmxH family sporulation protein n=1 Tax=Thermoflavimicrobium daqui TaxID=2137476 RepID=A0A364K6V4_9BACL|nr:YlmC/YmxH family sporulation protein [Thermoflavimicrobium daqui]RAL26023.1 YlmC/YmxH family sporulation protein [Thermoflavimicrobium daqui]
MIKISELQAKDVVNIIDGRKLGQIHDLELDLRQGVIKAVIVPSETRFFGWFSGGQEWVIPWKQIIKIGSDVILVRLDSHESPSLLNRPFTQLPTHEKHISRANGD